MRARELQRLAESKRESKSMDEAKAERDEPAAFELGPDDVLERHVHDRECDQQFDQRREPERVRRETKHRRRERETMSHRERRHDRDQWSEPPKWNDQAEDEQQVVDSVENVVEAERHEAKGRLMPSWIEPHEPRVAHILERAFGAVGRQEAQDGRRAYAETRERGVDRETRLWRRNRKLDQ